MAAGALVKLSSVVHSLARTKTARVILEAIAGGESDPRALAGLACGRVTTSDPAGTTTGPTATARSAPTSASSRPSA